MNKKLNHNIILQTVLIPPNIPQLVLCLTLVLVKTLISFKQQVRKCQHLQMLNQILLDLYQPMYQIHQERRKKDHEHLTVKKMKWPLDSIQLLKIHHDHMTHR